MTAVMQSSTAAIAVTLSAFYAGAVGLDQGCALIIGQNIGTATSSAMAAIGASTMAKRLAVAYILFKLIAALIALVLFPFTTPLLARAESAIDGVTLLAAYHTAYNVVGVVVLMPAIDWFTRVVERLLPERGSPLTRGLDRAALVKSGRGRRGGAPRGRAFPGDAVRLTVSALEGASGGKGPTASVATDALRQAREFLSDVSGPPETKEEELRLTSTLHALDHASRLAEMLQETGAPTPGKGGPDELHAAELCKAAMRWAQTVAESITMKSALSERAPPIGWQTMPEAEAALRELESAAKALDGMQRVHRTTTLAAVAPGKLNALEAFDRVDAVRRLNEMAHLAWRAAAHLLGHGA